MRAETLVVEIIKEQSLIIGENLAKSRAEDTGVIKFNSYNIEDLTLTQQNTPQILETLIGSYEELFGQASVEVCFEVMKRHPLEEINPLLPQKVKERLNKKI